MVAEVRSFDVTVATGSTPGAPATYDVSFPVREVRWIDVQVPDGVRGTVGFAFASGGVQMFPQAGSPMVVVNGQGVHWDVEGAIDSGAWQMLAYNIGAFDHTLYVSFGLDPVTAPPGSSGQPTTTLGTGTLLGGGEGTPVPAPPTLSLPVSLPPTPPLLPGAPASTAQVDTLLVGVASLGQVWLLDEQGYSQLTDQDDIDALAQDNVPTVAVSGQMHANIIAVAGMPATVSLGRETISGTWLPAAGRIRGNPPAPRPTSPAPTGVAVGAPPTPRRLT